LYDLLGKRTGKGCQKSKERRVKFNVVASTLVAASMALSANVSIQVNADSGHIPVSPWIYGRNGVGVSTDPAYPTNAADLSLPKEAGLRFARQNGGNNCTKYNWRKKISSHPDWYNNVYAEDWGFSAQEVETMLPGVQGMYGFQLLGWVASNTDNNFNDNAYNGSKWWKGVGQDLAGGGTPDTAGGSVPKKMGDPNKYLEPWPADSSAAILKHWFGPGGLGRDSTRFRYWSMDNEIEVWDGTHNDVDPPLTGHLITAEEAVQRWAAVAKAARKLYPGIKLVGPASSSEWQWYTWPKNTPVSYKGKNYCWPEYLIKRLAEIQDSTGVRMLDVYAVHFYLSATVRADVLQQHRLLWDTVYLDPNANGVYQVNGGWDTSIKHQMFFKRIQDWVDKYFGKGNGIEVGATEGALDGTVSNDPSMTATWYASMLGTFADHGAEIFSPWSWYAGMWETMHLFSRYGQTTRVKSVSSLDSLVSAYSSISARNDSMTVILVNRSASSQTANVSLVGFTPTGSGTSLRLANLSGETFVSHAQNALQRGTVSVSNGAFSTDLPAYSVTAYVFAKPASAIARRSEPVQMRRATNVLELQGGPEGGSVGLRGPSGIVMAQSSWKNGSVRFDLSGLPRGVYFVDWVGGRRKVTVASR
jgi:hypothetical protein